MTSRRPLAALALLVFSAACLAQISATTGAARPDPIAYLNRTLDEMQKRALRRATVDWPRVRAEALARASHAETTVDTYDAIRFALASLGDHHSSLHLTTELEHLESERKARNSTAHEPATPERPPSPFTGRYQPEGRMAKFGDRYSRSWS